MAASWFVMADLIGHLLLDVLGEGEVAVGDGLAGGGHDAGR